MKLNVIIVEDEFPTAQMMEDMILDLRPDWNIAGVFDSIKETVDWLKNNEAPDLLFLDIQLADGLSFSIFEQVKVESPIIFTTAYDEHAIRAFKLNSVDYLLKPVKQNLLDEAIQKYERIKNMIENKEKAPFDIDQLLKTIKEGDSGYRKRFLVSKREAFFKVPVEEIAYIEFDAKITLAVTFDGVEHLINFTLEKLEDELNPDMFMRANRQTIVNINAIDSFESYFGSKLMVKLLPKLNHKIVISRAKASAFKAWLDR